MVNYKKILLMGCLLTASGCLQAAENPDQGATGGSRRVSPSAPPTVAVDSLAAASETESAGAATGGAAGGSGAATGGAAGGSGAASSSSASDEDAASDPLRGIIREGALTYVNKLQEHLEVSGLMTEPEGSAAPTDEDPRNVGETAAAAKRRILKKLIEDAIEEEVSKLTNNLIQEKLEEAALRPEGSAAPIDENPRNVGETNADIIVRMVQQLLSRAIEKTTLKFYRGN